MPDIAVGAPTRAQGGAVFLLNLNKDGTVAGGVEISQSEGGFSSAEGSGSISGGDSFGGRGISNLGDLDGDTRDELIVGAYGADTHGAAWILYLDENQQVRRKVKISSSDLGVTAALSQKKTDGAQFGHSLAALGENMVAISANNEG